MPKLVCSKDQVELRCALNEVNVIEYSNNGPYKIWEADEWECPECHVKVITGFAQNPLAESYQANFVKDVALAQADTKHLRRDFESREQRQRFSAKGDGDGA